MMQGRPHRAWCAKYQWPSRQAFLFGTVLMPHGASMRETEAALIKEFDRRWAAILPDGTARPELKNLIPGALIFVPEGE